VGQVGNVTPAELFALAERATWSEERDSRQEWQEYLAAEETLNDLACDLARLCAELGEAARPFGEFAQELLNGHPTGRLPPGAPEALLAALAKLAELEAR